VPEFIEPEISPPNNPVNWLFRVGALQQMVYRHKISTEANSDRLLGSAKPGHTEPSD